MPRTKDELAALVVEHLVELNARRCSITDEMIEAEDNEFVQELLVGLLTLHEDLEYREQERQRIAGELRALNAKLDTRVAQQSQAILELSTPILQVLDGVLIMPLVGMIDTLRAAQIVDNLLASISRDGATVAIIDLTGVPMVDTFVASHLMHAISGARLLGAEVILTGISATTAQMLVKLRVDLSGIVTKSSLKSGLQAAMQMTERQLR